MTTDLSGCVNDGFPEFQWNDLVDLSPEEFQPTNVELGTGPNALGQENNCPISQCSNLTPLVDTPFSPPLSERGPTRGRYDYTGPNVTGFTAPLNSHIQGISVRFGVIAVSRMQQSTENVLSAVAPMNKFVRRQY